LVEITNKEELEAWLKEQPRAVSVAIAARAALRVLPLAADYVAGDPKDRAAALVLPLFRAIAVARLAGTWPSRATAVEEAADSAYAAADSAARSAATAVWAQINHDVTAITGDRTPERLMRQALWTGGTPEDVRSAWESLKATLLARDQDWPVWTAWYDDILRGADASKRRRLIEELELKRVLIGDADWKQGPAHVNALIAALEAEYRVPVPEPGQDDVPPEDRNAGRFRETGYRIDADALAGHDAVATDPIAQDLHAEAVRFARALLDIAGQLRPGANTPHNLLGIATLLAEATGDTVDTARPGLLIPRAAALQTTLDADDMRQADPEFEGPPLSADQRAALTNANNAYKTWINTDPFLAGMDGARLGKAARPVDPQQVNIIVSLAVEQDAATPAAQDMVHEAEKAGSDSQYYKATALNFVRRGLKIAVNTIKVIRHPVRAGFRVSVSVARWLMKNEEEILSFLEGIPDLRDTAKRIIELLKELPLDKL